MGVCRRVAHLLLGFLLAGCLGGQDAARPGVAPAAPARTAPPGAIDGFRSPRTYAVVAAPVRLRIPAIRVVTPLQRLTRQRDGQVAVPSSARVAGWYAEGPRPGQPGPAVLLGHVDSRSGPGVFFRLSRLSRGARVHVDRADGSSITFRVTRVTRVAKVHFPTELVYSPTLEPALQLVTCGGQFDEQRRSYRDNVIVYTVPA